MSKKKRTLSPEYRCTKLFTNLTMMIIPKPACVYSPRLSLGIKQLLAPATILQNYIKKFMTWKIASIIEHTKNWKKKNSDFFETLAPTAILPKLYQNHYVNYPALQKIRKIDYFRETCKIMLKTANKLLNTASHHL